MACVVSKSSVRLEHSRDIKVNMAEGKGAVSRRSTRTFTEDQVAIDSGNSSMILYKSRSPTPDESDQPNGDYKFSSSILPAVDIGMNLCGIFPSTPDDMGKQVIKSLQQAAQLSTKVKEDGRPFNFGIVSPSNIYRSSMPMVEDFQYLETLGLKTILSLVQKDFSPEFRSFMQKNSIRHLVIDMPGTKKIPIAEDLMASIMKIVLDKENYSLLIHCNHGKHRTGCAVAVVRYLIGWRVESIVEEYRGFAEPKVRECDVEYIMKYKVSSLQGLFVTKKIEHRGAVLKSKRWRRIFMVTAMVLAIWLATLLCW